MYADCLSGQSALAGAIGNQWEASWCVCVHVCLWLMTGAGAGEIPRNPIFLGSLPFGLVHMLWLCMYVDDGCLELGMRLLVGSLHDLDVHTHLCPHIWVGVGPIVYRHSVIIVLRQSRRGCPALCPVFTVIDREHIRVGVTSVITLIPQSLPTILVYENEYV